MNRPSPTSYDHTRAEGDDLIIFLKVRKTNFESLRAVGVACSWAGLTRQKDGTYSLFLDAASDLPDPVYPSRSFEVIMEVAE